MHAVKKKTNWQTRKSVVASINSKTFYKSFCKTLYNSQSIHLRYFPSHSKPEFLQDTHRDKLCKHRYWFCQHHVFLDNLLKSLLEYILSHPLRNHHCSNICRHRLSPYMSLRHCRDSRLLHEVHCLYRSISWYSYCWHMIRHSRTTRKKGKGTDYFKQTITDLDKYFIHLLILSSVDFILHLNDYDLNDLA